MSERRGCPSCGTWFDTVPNLQKALEEAERALEACMLDLTIARATVHIDGRTDIASEHIAAILKGAHAAYDAADAALSTTLQQEGSEGG